jgi:hypothetical protein
MLSVIERSGSTREDLGRVEVEHRLAERRIKEFESERYEAVGVLAGRPRPKHAGDGQLDPVPAWNHRAGCAGPRQADAERVTETLQGKKEQTSRSVVSCFSDSVAVLQSRRTVDSGSTESELAQSALRTLSTVLRDCKTATLSEKQLTT